MILSMRKPYVTTLAALLVIVLTLSFVELTSLISRAQDIPNTISLAVSPQILDITANPGESIDNTFRLTNASDQSVEINAIAKNFRPVGEEGAVDITTDDTTFSIASWTTAEPQNVVIQPRTTQDFAVNIAVPANVEPGSHYGSVVFSTVPPEQEVVGALVSQEIAPVILVKVAGDVVEAADIEEFKTGQSFYSNENTITFNSRLSNTGSVHFKPKGIITIKNMWGSQVAELELDRRNVLPGTIRQITTEWQPEGFTVGRYSATLSIVYGDSDEIRISETSFIVFPYQTILPIVAVISVVGLVGYKSRKRLALAARVLSGKDQSQPKDKKPEDS